MNAANIESRNETVTPQLVFGGLSDTTVTVIDEAALLNVGGGSLVNFY